MDLPICAKDQPHRKSRQRIGSVWRARTEGTCGLRGAVPSQGVRSSLRRSAASASHNFLKEHECLELMDLRGVELDQLTEKLAAFPRPPVSLKVSQIVLPLIREAKSLKALKLSRAKASQEDLINLVITISENCSNTFDLSLKNLNLNTIDLV
jgi:hypothetical protein